MKLLLTVLLTMIAVTAHCEQRWQNKRVVCDDRIEVFRAVVEDFQELPAWRGFSPLQMTELMLTVNPKTGAWTLIEYRDDWACVIGVGENSSTAWGTPA